MKKVWVLLAIIIAIVGIIYYSFNFKTEDIENIKDNISKSEQIDNSSGENVDNDDNIQIGIVDKSIEQSSKKNVFENEAVKQEDKKEIKEKEEREAESIDRVDSSSEDKNVVKEDIKDETDEIKEEANKEDIEESNENIVEEEKEVANEEANEQKENEDTVQNLAISQDKISSVENSVSLADKAKAVKLILTKLSPSDIKLLKDMLNGGLTEEEKKKAIELAYSRFSEEEIKLIKELYNKYMKN
ncbi:hypothetical protein [Caloranaerobacter ferrireducens]|uniref:hypothetical protein n=1 Tax=Caloranaerobacter ferrireducens TaxID=1323370 RepID=UPI00084DF13B|nr:hypothetical protein [Caloranaerobacter ferrireducens]